MIQRYSSTKGLFLSNVATLLILLFMLTGCATHPLGMNDEEWARLTPEQQLQARTQDEKNKLARERLRLEKQKQLEKEQLKRDVAEGMIFQFVPERPYCIGGEKCPNDHFAELILSLRRLADVDRVVFFADDHIGHKHDGQIEVLADNVLVSNQIDIKQRGNWYQVLVARPARNITLRTVGDDEVEISHVKIFGSWATEEKQYLIIK